MNEELPEAIFYRCPKCGGVLKQCNPDLPDAPDTVYYSDGRKVSEEKQTAPYLTKCRCCGGTVWLLDENQVEGREQLLLISVQERELDWATLPELDDLYDILDELDRDEEGEDNRFYMIYVRRCIWHRYNEMGFETTSDIGRWFENIRKLYELLDHDDDDDCCMIAEIYRNTCQFQKCRKVVEALPEDFSVFAERQLEECDVLNPLTVQINQLQKQILVDGDCELIIDADNEPVFHISAVDADGDWEPMVAYDGGENALLYRGSDQVVILTGIPVEKRSFLYDISMVAIVEFRGGGKGKTLMNVDDFTRRYEAEVVDSGSYAVERGILRYLPDEEFPERVVEEMIEMFHHNREQAEDMLKMHLESAELCVPEAQYVVARIYASAEFDDRRESFNWMLLAAFQGYRKAVEYIEQYVGDFYRDMEEGGTRL